MRPESVEYARRKNATRIIARVADLGPADAVIVVTPATTRVEVIDEILEMCEVVTALSRQHED